MRSMFGLRSTFVSFHHNSVPRNDSDFLNSIIHELKTPLNALLFFSESLQNDIRNPHAASECIDYSKEINRAALDMDELIHDLLDIGSVRSGNFSVDLSREIDVAEMIKRSMRLNHSYALKKQISIKTKISDNITPIKLDPKRVKQILTNLISNAIKYSPENTEITIEAKRDTASSENVTNPDVLTIIISDQGFGMSQEQVGCLFAKYRTFENPNSGKVDSLGLGLAITKQLVELQNGKIEITSKAQKGTKAQLTFPYAGKLDANDIPSQQP